MFHGKKHLAATKHFSYPSIMARNVWWSLGNSFTNPSWQETLGDSPANLS
jgi:hypothetical protein